MPTVCPPTKHFSIKLNRPTTKLNFCLLFISKYTITYFIIPTVLQQSIYLRQITRISNFTTYIYCKYLLNIFITYLLNYKTISIQYFKYFRKQNVIINGFLCLHEKRFVFEIVTQHKVKHISPAC